MKSVFIAFLIIAVLLLNTASALIPGIRYIRRSQTVENPQNNEIRIYPGQGNGETYEGENDSPQTMPENGVQKTTENARNPMRFASRIMGIPSGIKDSTSRASFYNNRSPSWRRTADGEEMQNTMPADENSQLRRRPYPSRKNTFDNSEPLENSDQRPEGQYSAAAINRIRQFANLSSVLANIARIPKQVAQQIDSVLGGFMTTYPSNTNVGAYINGMRFLLNNQGSLRVFDMLDAVGVGRLEELISSMPAIFDAIITYIKQMIDAISRRIAALVQNVRDNVGNIRERARGLIPSVQVTRNSESLSVNIPDNISMIVKGQLLKTVDRSLEYMHGLLGTGTELYNYVGSNVNEVAKNVNEVAKNVVEAGQNYPSNVNVLTNHWLGAPVQ